MKHIRKEYENHGVDNFYSKYWNQYKNPHFEDIRTAIKILKNAWELKIGHSLDLCAGGGEITSILDCSEGCDPYTHELYVKNTGKPCLTYSFDDIFDGKLTKKYDTIICSYALHLADKSKLPQIIYQLSCICEQFLLISPTKKPILNDNWGLKLVNEGMIFGVKVRLYKTK